MEKKLLEILVCPICKGPIKHSGNELICPVDRVAYPIRDGIPVMLVDEVRELPADEDIE